MAGTTAKYDPPPRGDRHSPESYIGMCGAKEYDFWTV